MALKLVKIGAPLSGEGDSLPDAFEKGNSNASELFEAVETLNTRLDGKADLSAEAGRAILEALARALPTSPPSEPGKLWLNDGSLEISR